MVVKLNGGIGKPYADQYKPNFRNPNGSIYIYKADGTEKNCYISSGGCQQQNPASDGDYFIFLRFCSGDETQLELSYSKGNNRGIFDIYINGVLDSSGYDAYASSTTIGYSVITMARPLVYGRNEIKVVVNGKNASSSAHFEVFYGVRLR